MKIILIVLTATLITLSTANASNENIIQAATRWDEEVWKDIPGQNFAKFYIFNVTNANKFNYSQILEKPVVKEVGPYVYLIKREKFNISQNFEDGSFQYREKRTYEFQPQLSNGRTEDDIVHVINTALITFLTRHVIDGGYFLDMEVRYIMEGEGEELILKNQTVADILFNGRNASVYVKYEDKILDNKRPPPGFEAFEDGRYGIFKGMSGNNLGLLRVEPRATGSKVGQIISWKEQRQLSIWGGDECNKISGGDGSIFSPELTEKNDLEIFLPEISRSVPLTFKESVDYGGISGDRYKIPDTFLEEIELRPENQCFCTDHYSRCLRRGGLDLQATLKGAPYVLTYPHFMKADGVYASRVDGLIPAPSIHESFYDIEPKTGTVLQSSKRFQYNIRVGQIASSNVNLTYFRPIKDYVFPLLWVEESFQLDGDIVAALRKELDGDGEVENPKTTETEVPVTTTTTVGTEAPSPSTTTVGTEGTTAPPSSTSTTEKNEIEPEQKECAGVSNDSWISGRFSDFNLHLYFLTFLVIISIAVSGFCVSLLIINAQATKTMMRAMNNKMGGTINSIYSSEPHEKENEKV